MRIFCESIMETLRQFKKIDEVNIALDLFYDNIDSLNIEHWDDFRNNLNLIFYNYLYLKLTENNVGFGEVFRHVQNNQDKFNSSIKEILFNMIERNEYGKNNIESYKLHEYIEFCEQWNNENYAQRYKHFPNNRPKLDKLQNWIKLAKETIPFLSFTNDQLNRIKEHFN